MSNFVELVGPWHTIYAHLCEGLIVQVVLNPKTGDESLYAPSRYGAYTPMDDPETLKRLGLSLQPVEEVEE